MPEAISTAAPPVSVAQRTVAGPSSLYRGGSWKLALTAARALPVPLAKVTATAASHLYRIASPHRRRIVFENLQPVFENDAQKTTAATNRLFSRFATKMVDLLRFEAGADATFAELNGWEIFERAHTRDRGTLLVTPHLGNWEVGGPLLTKKGVKIFAVTQAEPGSNFTEMRRTARARWGIETIVVGQDAFAFIEIIRRLQEGASVAMLIDRPAAQSAVHVELFGKRFAASLAPAELARASGCGIIGAAIVEEKGAYVARFLPEFEYDRRALGNRDARGEFTQRIVKAFEPIIRKHADQWYHFVPIWPKQ